MIKNIVVLLFLISTFSTAITFEEAKEIEKTQGIIKALSIYKTLAKENNPECYVKTCSNLFKW